MKDPYSRKTIAGVRTWKLSLFGGVFCLVWLLIVLRSPEAREKNLDTAVIFAILAAWNFANAHLSYRNAKASEPRVKSNVPDWRHTVLTGIVFLLWGAFELRHSIRTGEDWTFSIILLLFAPALFFGAYQARKNAKARERFVEREVADTPPEE